MKEKKKGRSRRFVRYGLMLLIILAASFLLFWHWNRQAMICRELREYQLDMQNAERAAYEVSPTGRYIVTGIYNSIAGVPPIIQIDDMKTCGSIELDVSRNGPYAYIIWGWSPDETYLLLSPINIGSPHRTCKTFEAYSPDGKTLVASSCLTLDTTLLSWCSEQSFMLQPYNLDNGYVFVEINEAGTLDSEYIPEASCPAVTENNP